MFNTAVTLAPIMSCALSLVFASRDNYSSNTTETAAAAAVVAPVVVVVVVVVAIEYV